jgi:hypothetical protein
VRARQDRLPRAGERGRRTRTVVPSPSTLFSSIEPLWASTTARAIVRPSPVPSMARSCAAEARKNRSKSRLCSAAGTPIPVSETASTTSSPFAPSATTTRPPGGVNLTAFETRLSRSCPRRAGVAPQSRDGGRVEPELNRSSLGDGAQHLYRLLGEQAEVGLADLEGQPAGFDLRDEEEVAHQAEEALGVAVDDVEKAPGLVAEALVFLHELQVARDGRERRAQLVRHERDELVLEAVVLAQAVVLLEQEPLRRLGLSLSRPLARIQPLPLGSDALELAHDAGQAPERQDRQYGRADDDADRVLDAPERGFDREDDRGGEGGRDERAQAQARETGRVATRGRSQVRHRRVQRGGPRAEVADEPEGVDPRAGGVSARDLQPDEGRVGGDHAHHSGGEQREGGRGRAGREEQADEQREQEHVHQRVGGGERPLHDAEAGVGRVGLDQEHPGDEAGGDRDDGRVAYRPPKWCAGGIAPRTSASFATRRASGASEASSETRRFLLRSTRSKRPRAMRSGSPRTSAR